MSMTKSKIITKIKELIAAPSCNSALKSAAEEYLKAQDKKTADVLVKALEDNVCSIDELIGLCESDTGKNLFGAEKAAVMAKAAKDAKATGEKFCICPACQAGYKIYDNREILA